MQVKEIMTTQVATIGPDNTVLDAAKVMQAHNIGSIPVCQQNGKVIGIVTDRDIIVRNIANSGDPKTALIKDLMTKEVISANPTMDIDLAVKIMAQNKVRRLPVINNDAIVGMIAIGDLATRHILRSEAGNALSEISEPSRPVNLMQ